MTGGSIVTAPSMNERRHIALHLAHRWFAFFEAPGGDLDAHLAMFHPQVRLSGNRGGHLFARDRESLKAWFAAVPDDVNSHHIVHSGYATDHNGDGLLDMVVAYQSLDNSAVHGSIISYQTRIEFAPEGPRFTALDKTPILPNTKPEYETSWAANRVLARVHAELGGLVTSDGRLRLALGSDVRQLFAHAVAPEGSLSYQALVTSSGGGPSDIRMVRLTLTDDGKATIPIIEGIEPLAPR